MVAQQKLLRVFKLIRTLSRKPGKTVAQLARLLDTSERSVYRYLNLLEEVGYLLDKDAYERYYLFESENEKVKPSFEAEEADLIRDLVTPAAAHHPLKDAILKKLYLNSELIPLADNLLKTQVAQLIHRLGEAIRERKQAVLHHYHSSITDRLVEPMDFTNNYQQLIAYEAASRQVKNFKVERIEEVALLDSKQLNQKVLQESQDLFGIPGRQPLSVTLRLNLRAAMLLREEYPLSTPFIKPDEQADTYVFAGTVNGWEGVGRFCLGLPGEVEVQEPEALQGYLRERVKGWI